MTKDDVIKAIKEGKSVEYCGNKVTAEGIKYSWQTPVVWVNFKNGSGYIAGYKELLGMNIITPAKLAMAS
jgi:hypothetical protein